jgi:hypothetical protein
MIKPPFTVLVLKDAHDPVTLRITGKLVVMLLVVVCCVIGLAGYGAVRLIPDEVPELPAADIEAGADERGYILPEDVTGEQSFDVQSGRPDVTNMSIDTAENSELLFDFSFTGIPPEQNLFVWIIINPGDSDDGMTVIHPRSPIFRGMPVDYRNGIPYSRAQGVPVTAMLPEMAIGIDFTRFRVLAYSETGDIVVDKTFSIHKNIKL